MAETPRPWKAGRIAALVLMGLIVFFTLTGGIGTTRAALGAENYESMARLVPYKPLYQVLVVISIAAGISGILVMISLVRGGAYAYRNAIIVLVGGAVTSGIQTAVSQSVRGSSAPATVQFAVTVFTLIVFLLFLLPPLWRKMRFDQPLKGNAARTAGGASFAVRGLLTLRAPLWGVQTHMAALDQRGAYAAHRTGRGLDPLGCSPARHRFQKPGQTANRLGQPVAPLRGCPLYGTAKPRAQDHER